MLFMDAFGAQGINPSRKKNAPVFQSKSKRAQKSLSLWAKRGESSKIDGVCCKTCKMQRLNRYL